MFKVFVFFVEKGVFINKVMDILFFFYVENLKKKSFKGSYE